MLFSGNDAGLWSALCQDLLGSVSGKRYFLRTVRGIVDNGDGAGPNASLCRCECHADEATRVPRQGSRAIVGLLVVSTNSEAGNQQSAGAAVGQLHGLRIARGAHFLVAEVQASGVQIDRGA